MGGWRLFWCVFALSVSSEMLLVKTNTRQTALSVLPLSISPPPIFCLCFLSPAVTSPLPPPPSLRLSLLASLTTPPLLCLERAVSAELHFTTPDQYCVCVCVSLLVYIPDVYCMYVACCVCDFNLKLCVCDTE